MLASALVRDPDFQDRVVAETRQLLHMDVTGVACDPPRVSLQ
jgi:hypothetical protein